MPKSKRSRKRRKKFKSKGKTSSQPKKPDFQYPTKMDMLRTIAEISAMDKENDNN